MHGGKRRLGTGTRSKARRRAAYEACPERLYAQRVTHPNDVIQVNGFVAVNLDLDAASEYIDESFPLEVLWEGRSRDLVEAAGIDLGAVRILSVFDFASLVVSSKTMRTRNRSARQYAYASRKAQTLSMRVLPYTRPK